MAYIYRYRLRDTQHRKSTNLAAFKREIEDTIKIRFGENLKEVSVQVDYFEFKLYNTVPQGILQQMGRDLKLNLRLAEIHNGFIRIEQTFYALVYPNRKDEKRGLFHIEFLDSLILDNTDNFIERANDYIKRRQDYIVNKSSEYFLEDQQLTNNYYIDVLEGYVECNSIEGINFETDKITILYVKGYHRRINSMKNSYDNNLIQFIETLDVAAVEDKGTDLKQNDYIDCIKVLLAEKKSEEQVNEINKLLKLNLRDATEIKALVNYETGKEMEFCVHNVGQALATSLSYKEGYPFVYFDYGMPYGKNAFTRPKVVSMPTNPNITIIISHLDSDHWHRIYDDINAYTCSWFIPNQYRKILFNHKVAEIIVKGGSVEIVKNDIIFKNGCISCNEKSRINTLRAPIDVHETGLTMRLEVLNDNKKDINILISGDQDYDYQNINTLHDLDVLVACHHGGKYCWSKKGNVPDAKDENSIVIYSCGKGNTYGHPTKTSDYKAAKWKNEYRTTTIGEYKLIIMAK